MGKGIVKLGTDSRGNYRSDIGWKPKDGGGFKQHTFYFGTDQTMAQIRYLTTRRCWDAVETRWGRLPTASRGTRPLWSSLTVAIAKAVAAGNEAYYLEPEAYAVECGFTEQHQSVDLAWWKQLQEDFNMIRLCLADEKQAGQVEGAREARKARAERLADESAATVVSSGQTLHLALDAFAAWHQENYKTPDGRPTYHAYVAGERIKAIKKLAPDLSLEAFGLDEIERLIATWKNRPLSSRGKPYSVSCCKHHLKLIRGFVKWLHRSERFAWRKPLDYEAEAVNIRPTPEEKSKRVATAQVAIYTVEELATLWKHASPRERLLMSLTLNCSFGQAEISLLLQDELHLDQPHGYYKGLVGSFIKGCRNKTGVYGEWKLWPETVAGLEWWQANRPATKTPYLLTTEDGECLFKNPRNKLVYKSWRKLLQKVRRRETGFRYLPRKRLKSTAIDLVRQVGDGELAGIFQQHGKPVATDSLQELYSNKPFNKLFDVLDKVREVLAPMFASIADPFPASAGWKGLKKVDTGRVIEMRKAGAGYAEIKKATGLSTDKVCRILTGAGLVKPYKKD
jgi:hypothetical protein